MKTKTMAVAACAVLALAAGCSKSGGEATGSGAAAISGEAKDLFAQRCSTCHGADGNGNGPAGAALTPKPRDFTSGGWQKSVTDDQLRKTIVAGGAAVGKSPLMPPNPDLEGKPAVVDGLVAMVRSFGK